MIVPSMVVRMVGVLVRQTKKNDTDLTPPKKPHPPQLHHSDAGGAGRRRRLTAQLSPTLAITPPRTAAGCSCPGSAVLVPLPSFRRPSRPSSRFIWSCVFFLPLHTSLPPSSSSQIPPFTSDPGIWIQFTFNLSHCLIRYPAIVPLIAHHVSRQQAFHHRCRSQRQARPDQGRFYSFPGAVNGRWIARGASSCIP